MLFHVQSQLPRSVKESYRFRFCVTEHTKKIFKACVIIYLLTNRMKKHINALFLLSELSDFLTLSAALSLELVGSQ